MNRSSKAARIATVAMWVMIGVILLSFFISAPWIRAVWAIAAVVCIICMIIVGYSKYR